MDRPNVAALLAAMRADAIPENHAGPWRILRYSTAIGTKDPHGRWVSPGTYTALLRTDHVRPGHPEGESVMSDHGAELRRHLEFLLRAEGRVLVTGLGLGCVVRGLLELPRIESIDVVERDPHVIGMVAPHLPDDKRVTIHLMDACDFVASTKVSWDFAWHDLWSTESESGMHLVHTRLLFGLRGRVRWQGAWAFPRFLRRLAQIKSPETRAWSRFPFEETP